MKIPYFIKKLFMRDSTKEILKALNEISEKGGMVYIKPGIYKFDIVKGMPPFSVCTKGPKTNLNVVK